MWPFKKRKKQDPIKTGFISLFCSHCKSTTEVDLDNIQVYCPFCGEELMVPAGVYKDLYQKKVVKQ